jgi:hypothetical protein
MTGSGAADAPRGTVVAGELAVTGVATAADAWDGSVRKPAPHKRRPISMVTSAMGNAKRMC